MKLWCQHPIERRPGGCGRELIEDSHGPDFTYWSCPDHGTVVMVSSDAMDSWPMMALDAGVNP